MRPLALLMLLLIAAPMTRAQDSAWPPDPADIFAEGVEVVSIDFPPPYGWYFQHGVKVDNDARVITLFDHTTGQSRQFPYQREVETLLEDDVDLSEARTEQRIVRRSDGMILLNVPSLWEVPTSWPDVWLFDPITGEFSEPQIVCGYHPQALVGEGYWVFYRDLQTNQLALCHTETGRIGPVFPEYMQTFWERSIRIILSPNQDWLLFSMYNEREGKYVLYSYHPLTDKLNLLGHLEFTDFIRVDHWLSNTVGVLFESDFFGGNLYWFDLAVPNTLVNAGLPNAHLVESPPHYVNLWTRVDSANLGTAPQWPCRLHVYRLNERKQYVFDLGYECNGAASLTNGDYVYLGFDAEVISEATVWYLDIDTGERTALLTGEIESFESISPDERYLVVFIDNSGLVDTVRVSDRQFLHAIGNLGDLHVEIFDRQRGEYVYRLPKAPESLVIQGWHDQNENFLWLDSKTLMVFYNDRGVFSAIRVFFGENDAEVMKIERLIHFPNLAHREQRYFEVMASREKDSTAIDLFDGLTGTYIPLIREYDSERYSVSVYGFSVENDTIRVSVSDTTSTRRPAVTYTIRIPQAGE